LNRLIGNSLGLLPSPYDDDEEQEIMSNTSLEDCSTFLTIEKIELLPSPYDEEEEDIMFVPHWTSNTSLEDCSTFNPGFNYDGISFTIQSNLMISPETNLDDDTDDSDDDLDSSNSTYDMIKNLVEFVLDNDDDDYDDNDDNYHCFLITNGEIMAQLVQHGDDDGYVGDDEVDDLYYPYG